MASKRRRLESSVLQVDMERFKDDATQSSVAGSFLHTPEDPYYFPSEADDDLGQIKSHKFGAKTARRLPKQTNSLPQDNESFVVGKKAKATKRKEDRELGLMRSQSAQSKSRSSPQKQNLKSALTSVPVEEENCLVQNAKLQKTRRAVKRKPIISTRDKKREPKTESLQLKRSPTSKEKEKAVQKEDLNPRETVLNPEEEKSSSFSEFAPVVLPSQEKNSIPAYLMADQHLQEREPKSKKQDTIRSKEDEVDRNTSQKIIQIIPESPELFEKKSSSIHQTNSQQPEGNAAKKVLGFSRRSLGTGKISAVKKDPSSIEPCTLEADLEVTPQISTVQKTCSPAISKALDEIERSIPAIGPLRKRDRNESPQPEAAAILQKRPKTSEAETAISQSIQKQGPIKAYKLSRFNPDTQSSLQPQAQTLLKQEMLRPGESANLRSRLANDAIRNYYSSDLQRQSKQRDATGVENKEHSFGSNLKNEIPIKASKSSTIPERRKPKPSQKGLMTPLLLRHAFHPGLSKALSGKSLKTPAPAITIMEAQESGEQRLVQDNMLYALDGLCTSSSLKTHIQAASSFLDISATKRGRQALRCDGVLQEALSTAKAILAKSWDINLALIFSAIINFFATDAANLNALGCKEAIHLILCLVEGRKSKEEEGGETESREGVHPMVTRLTNELETSSSIPKSLPIQHLPSAITLSSFVGAIDPREASAASEEFKESIREHGLLSSLAQGAIQNDSQAEDAWTSWKLRTYLIALENSTFACPQNEAFLVKLRIQDGSIASSFVSKLVAIAKVLAKQIVGNDDKRQCLHCALSVAMNITHYNDNGCQQVVNAGGHQLALEMLANLALEGREAKIGEGLKDNELVSVAMGLLINIADNCVQSLHPLTEPTQDCDLLHILCQVFEKYSERKSNTSQDSEGELAFEELTEDQLSVHEDSSLNSILEVYAALLIGFLAASKPILWARAEQHLTLKTLSDVLSKVQQCLGFYAATGSITEKTEQSLKALVAAMTAKLENS